MSKKTVFKRIGLFLIIYILIGSLFLSFSFLFDKKNPTYENVPYTIEEPKVYVTTYGDCYHSYSCSYLHSSRISKGKEQARSQGYRACSKCYGVSNGTIEVTYYKKIEKDMKNEIIVESIISGAIVSAIICVFIPLKTRNKNED